MSPLARIHTEAYYAELRDEFEARRLAIIAQGQSNCPHLSDTLCAIEDHPYMLVCSACGYYEQSDLDGHFETLASPGRIIDPILARQLKKP